MTRSARTLALAGACGLCSCVDTPATTTDATASPASTGTGDATAGHSSASMSGATDPGGSTGTTSTGEPGTTAPLGDTSTGEGTTGGTSTGGPVCGDGVVDPGEDCDDGNGAEDDGCLSNCVLGPGGALPPLPLPPLAEDEFLRCFTAIDGALLGRKEHALVLGSEILTPDDWNIVIDAHVRRLPLPDADPEAWTYLEHAGVFGREPHRAVTADNGDVIVAGVIYTEVLKPDSFGYAWRARFAPDGTLVWNHEDETMGVFPSGIALTPQGDLVVAGNWMGFNSWPDLRVYGPDGAVKAHFTDPGVPGHSTWYSDVAVDGEGNIYVLGSRRVEDGTHSRVLLQGLLPDASFQWSTEVDSPTHVIAGGSSIVLTADGVLLATAWQYDDPNGWQAPGPLGIAAFATDGTELWWKEWSPPEPWHPQGGPLVADADGGAYAAGSLSDGDAEAVYATHLTADGDPMWANVSPGEQVWDALLGPDGLFYILTKDAIVPHLP